MGGWWMCYRWKHLLGLATGKKEHYYPLPYLFWFSLSSSGFYQSAECAVRGSVTERCLLCSRHPRCSVGRGERLCGGQEAAPGGVVPDAGALPDSRATTPPVASGEGADGRCAGAAVCGPQHAQNAEAASPGDNQLRWLCWEDLNLIP